MDIFSFFDTCTSQGVQIQKSTFSDCVILLYTPQNCFSVLCFTVKPNMFHHLKLQNARQEEHLSILYTVHRLVEDYYGRVGLRHFFPSTCYL